MAKRLTYLPWFPGDFMSATRGWSVTAKGVYRELLDAQWDLGVLPANPEELRRLIGATETEWGDGWSRCSTKFISVDGGLQNSRLEEHRSKALSLSVTRREIGQRGGRASATARAEAIGQAIAQPNAEPIAQAKVEHSSPLNSSQNSGVSSGDSRPLPRTGTTPPFHLEVIEAYHELLPDLPAIKEWPSRRRSKLDARIRNRVTAGKPAKEITYWREVFAKAAASDFLCGRKTDWRCPGLEWLLEPRNFTKLIEGGYDNHSRNGTGEAHAR